MVTSTLAGWLERRGAETPDRVAYIFLNADETEVSLTYERLDRAARTIAARLGGLRATPVLVCYPPGLDYLSAFFGCLYAGAIPVPAYPPEPGRLERTLPRLAAMAGDSGAAAALVPAPLADEVRELLGARPEAAGLSLLAVEPGAGGGGEAPGRHPDASPDDPAFLMYTSGSTASPRGVVVTHRNALHNLASFPGFATRPVTCCVSWLPLFHDLGLMMGMLHPLYRGVPGVMMAPLTFAQRPLRWIEAISRHRATTSGGPNFAYDLCVARSTPAERAALDLRCWNLALNGSEPVRPETLERFTAAFAPAGLAAETFYPSYGLAEGTATVTGAVERIPPTTLAVHRDRLEAGRAEEAPAADGEARVAPLVGCGPGLADQEIAIVDPDTRRRLEPPAVGEIWVRGPSVAVAYWRRPEETESRLRARLDDGSGPFLRTGDLGFIHRGEVVVAGRLKDLIIVRGSNHHPEDVERTVAACHPALRPGCGAALGVETADGERLVIVHEVRGARVDAGRVAVAIRAAVADGHGLELHDLVLIEPGSIPKTSSGKIRRGTCRELYLRGVLKVAAGSAPVPAQTPAAADGAAPLPAAHRPADGTAPGAREIEDWLRTHLARELGADPRSIAGDRPFVRFGLTSVGAVSMVAALEAWLGRRLSPDLAWRHPTVEELARSLGGGSAPGPVPVSRPGGAASEPIAIVGMACRFPGAPGLDAYWELLTGGVDAITEVPAERWDADAYFDPDPAAPGKMVTRWGGFVDGIDRLDAAFFGLSPREAVHLDPQQRLLLEVCWEALEDAGIPPHDLAGSPTGVFVASLSNDYGTELFTRWASRVEAYSGTGNADTMAANRLSYFLDARGPSLAVDTACSGSLVAVHLACQSLLRGECRLALAGGVNVVLRPDANLFFTKAGALAPDGRSKPFDARANGMVRSDGAGLVVLKPLARALADGDRVYAVVRGSAVNQDGRSNGVMAPNGRAQEEVLREAYRHAGVAPARVQYVEAHGTGTRLGDLVEANALGAVLGAGRADGPATALGSVKSNIGHSEAAAGAASLIKAALAIHHRTLPASLHFESPNPLIDFAALRLAVQQCRGDWPAPGRELIAGVSGFGVGGTNAHVVLSEAPDGGAGEEETAEGRPELLVLSAADEAAVRQLAGRYAALLGGPGSPPLARVAWSAARRRGHLTHRLAVTAASAAEAAAALAAHAEGRPAPAVASGEHLLGRPPRVVMVFSGQGTQWARMGLELAGEEPAFAAVVRRCDGLFEALLGRSLLRALEAPAGDGGLDDTATAQAAIFAVQAGLAALWSRWGVAPHAVVGQSLGEVAAAWAAGALTLDQAVAVVHHRGRLMARVAGRGATAVVSLPPERAAEMLAGRDGSLAVAGHSGPEATVVSGEPEAVDRLVAEITERGVFARRLAGVDVAFHGPQMEPLAAELETALGDLGPRAGTVRMVSSVTAAEIGGERLDGAYWGRNLRRPFRFAEAVGTLIDEGCEVFLEVSPHPVLGAPIRGALRAAGRSARVLGSLRRDGGGRSELLGALGELYAAGGALRWEAIHPQRRRHLALPCYPWQRERFWLDQLGPADDAGAGRPTAAGGHPLLGRRVETAGRPDLAVWERDLDARSLHWLGEHRVHGMVVVPAAAFVEAVAAAATAAEMPDAGGFPRTPAVELTGVELDAAMVLADGARRRLQVAIDRSSGRTARFTVHSRGVAAGDDDAPAGWAQHAGGAVRTAAEAAAEPEPFDPAAELERCPEPLPPEDHYRWMRLAGLDYGSDFQAIRRLHRGEGRAVAELALRFAADGRAGRLHPVLLDAAFQTVAAAAGAEPPDGGEIATFVPAALDRVVLRPHTAAGPLWCAATLRPDDDGRERTADLLVADAAGRRVCEVEGLRLRRLGAAGGAGRDRLLAIEWRPVAAPPSVPAPSADDGGRWLVLADGGGLGERLAARLAERGEQSLLVTAGTGYAAGGERVAIDPARPDHFERLVREVVAASPLPCRGVIHLWSLDAAAGRRRSVRRLDRAATLGPQALALLVQALARSGWARVTRMVADGGWHQLPRVWAVTRGGQPVAAGESPDPLQAPLWGAGRVVAREHPELWGGLVDLDPAAAGDAAAADLAAALTPGWATAGVAARGGGWHAPRAVRFAGRDRRPPALRPDATYLVTGGLGDLGLATALWLASHGARRLVLIGRTPLPPRGRWSRPPADDREARRRAAILEIERLGTAVEVESFDVADGRRLAAFLARERRQRRPPIRGVVHTAGALRDRLIEQLEPGDFEIAWRPKAQGAWALHRALGDEPLELFVLFSSVAPVLGSFAQASYAAANAYLDALAYARRAAGLPAVSIGWGPWAEIGMAARAGLGELHRRGGIEALAPREALRLLERSLAAGAPPYLLAVRADWRQWARLQEPRAAELVAELAGLSPGGGTAPELAAAGAELLRELAAASPDERRDRVEALLAEIVAAALRLDPGAVHPGQPLGALGLDSIMAAEIATRTADALSVRLPPGDLLMGASLSDLAAEVLRELESHGRGEQPGPADAPRRGATAAAGHEEAR